MTGGEFLRAVTNGQTDILRRLLTLLAETEAS
jgi:hypothetical protein